MNQLKIALEIAVNSADSNFQSEILGSYRRGVGFSSDIDLLVRHKVSVLYLHLFFLRY